MTDNTTSYTARELERESGFDRRTIAYYVQEGLLPKVGRRGRRTRYPQLFLDRLLFIRRVREAEEAGEMPPVSLSEIRELFERVQATLIAEVAAGRIEVTPDLVASPSTTFDHPEPVMSAPPPPQPAPRRSSVVAEYGPPSDYGRDAAEELRLGRLLRRLDGAVRRRDRESGDHDESGDPVETWSRMRISPNIVLAVRGLADEDAPLADSVRRSLRRLLQRPWSSE